MTVEWTPITDDDLLHELEGVSFGERRDGATSTCGRFLVARVLRDRPLHSDAWEVWIREQGRWQVWALFRDRDHALAVVDRYAGRIA